MRKQHDDHESQSGHTEFKVVGKLCEQRPFVLRRVVRHLGDDAVGAFARLHVIDEKIRVVHQACGFESTQVLWKESGHEQGKIADVLVDIAFPVERLRFEQDLGFEQEVNDGIDRLPLLVFNFEQFGYYDYSHFCKHLKQFLQKDTISHLQPHLKLLRLRHKNNL